MVFLDTSADSVLGMPREYAFLVLGLIIGALIGWWVGRAWGIASAASRSLAETGPLASEAPGGLPPGVSLVVNGRNIEVPGESMAEIQGLVRAGQTIEAVKVLRSASGLGLAEAKAVLESLEKVMR